MNQTPSRHDAVYILAQTDKDFFVGIVGTGPGFESILQHMTKPELGEFFPRLNLVACAAPEFPPDLAAKVKAHGANLYEGYQKMLLAHPEINLLVELTSRSELLLSLRQFVPSTISILDHASAALLCAVLIMSKDFNKCKETLSEQQSLLHMVMDELHGDVLFLDAQGRILDANRHVRERLGKSKDELLHKPCWEVVGDGDQGWSKANDPTCPFQIAMNEGRGAEALQTYVNAQGRVRYYQVRAYPVLNRQGAVHKVIGIRRDVTLRTEMEKRLQQAEKLAAIGELSTYIAHEIRNPLFTIGGFANALLRSPELPEGTREKARIIIEESKRLDAILKSILNFARPTQADTSEVDVNTVILETLQLMGIGCEERGVKIDTRLMDGVAKIRGDAELLKQCLINLIKNALEAMPDGGILSVRSGMTPQDVFVAIIDTGVGIPLEDQEKIFSPFFTTKKKEGSGLGLAMTKKIIDDLGGSLRLESQVGRGTTVTIFLPPYVSIQRVQDFSGTDRISDSL
jgi:PAS domain S-box-containing protein